jgi:hypothetical protein
MFATHPQMRGDALSSEEDFHRSGGDAYVNFAAYEPIGNAIVVLVDLDVIVNADTAKLPLGEHIWFGRQGFKCWAV